jgi:subtilisin
MAGIAAHLGALAQDRAYIVTCQAEVATRNFTAEMQINATFHYVHVFNGFAARFNEAVHAQLASDPRVIMVEDDGRTIPFAQTIPSGVRRIGAHQSPIARVNGRDERVPLDVAILDTGIDLAHPDLNVYRSVGFADVGYNGQDWQGHGTHVAGIVAALDNELGVVGVAPGARLWSVQVLGPAISDFAMFLAGMDYVLEHADEIEVVNASMGGEGVGATARNYVRAAIQAAASRGVLFVAAAGNEGVDVYGIDGVYGTFDDFLPAAVPEALTVSAIEDYLVRGGADELAAFSNFSRSVTPLKPVRSPGAAIDLAAPGYQILSTHLNGGYAVLSGTSMAAPHITGLAALYMAANGRARNAEELNRIREALLAAALPQAQWQTTATRDPDPNPEPLGLAASSWAEPVRLMDARRIDQSIAFTFEAQANRVYTIEFIEALGPSKQWQAFQVISGRSGPVHIVDSIGALQQRYYRVVYQGAGL